MIKCQYPENSELSLMPCPNCGGKNVKEWGDDFDGDVGCGDCGLTTYLCFGTKAAINVWNTRNRIEMWTKL